MARVKITDKDRGFHQLMTSLGEMGSIRVGVQGEEAKQKHPSSDLTVGEIAAIHELGLGVPKRSWLVSWMDANAGRIQSETKSAFGAVMKGKKSRNQALIDLGYAWTKDIRQEISSGKITPALPRPRPDGSTEPLFDTHTLHNDITYKVFLPQKKSIRDAAQRKAVGRRIKK